MPNSSLHLAITLVALGVSLLGTSTAKAVPQNLATPRHALGADGVSDLELWRVTRLHGPESTGSRGSSVPRTPTLIRLPLAYDEPFRPTQQPSGEGSSVEQVIVTTEDLTEAFQELADHETARGIPTVIRTVSWIESQYRGPDTPARIRTFLRDAYDRWGTRYVVLGGDVDRIPTRYTPWMDQFIPSDLYYECLDGEWNEDGDAVFGEPARHLSFDGTVNDVVRAPDGRVWIATYHGVAYYDDGSFTSFREIDGLPSDHVYALGIADDGTVWAGTELGAARYNGLTWDAFGEAEGLPSPSVLSVLPISADEAWIGTGTGLAHYDQGVWTYPSGIPTGAVSALARDGTDVWVGTFAGAARISQGEVTVFDTSNSGILSDWVLSLSVSEDGVVWLGHVGNYLARGGLSRYEGGVWLADDLSAQPNLTVRDILPVGTDEIWAATSLGLFHRSGTGDVLFDAGDGILEPNLFGVVQNPDSTFWLAGVDGLIHGSPGNWLTLDESGGLPASPLDYDEIDLGPELVSGRIPAANAEQVRTYVRKLVDYREGVGSEAAERLLLLGEVLFTDFDGKDVCLDVAQRAPASFQVTERFESEGLLDRQIALDALEDGHGIILHVGHGSYDLLGMGPGLELLYNQDLGRYDSGGVASLLVSYNCRSGAFDHNCSMENALFNPNGGAVATLGNPRTAVATVDQELNAEFFDILFASEHGEPALAFSERRRDVLDEKADDLRFSNWWRRLYVTRSYLGAPTLQLWRKVPGSLDVSHPTTVPLARSSFSVNVTASGSGAPLENALVCVAKGTEDYAYGRTDASGDVEFSFRPESTGDLTVHVSAPDHLPYAGTATVGGPLGPNPVAASFSRSETEITFSVRNQGAATSSDWNVALICEDSRVNVVAGSGVLGALRPGEEGWTSPFEIQLDAALGDGEEIVFTLLGSGPTAFVETFRVPLSSADLTLVEAEVQGDEAFLRLRNRGGVSTGPLTATLTAADSHGTVLEGTVSGPAIPAGETVLFAEGFRVSGTPEATYHLTVQDAAGETLTKLIDLRAPAPATQAVAEPRDGGARISWNPSPSDDLAGYRIHSRSEGSPWSPLQEELWIGSSRAEVSIAAGSSREYLILAVDHSGHESADSCFVVAHSAPPTLAGWPQELTSVIGPSPIVCADLDDDGMQEILMGSMWEANAVHVFRADGSEWTDGDADRTTNGIFGRTQERVHAAPLVLDVDGDGSSEIFSTSFDGYVYGWRTDGGTGAPPAFPGWPVYLGPNGSRTSPVAGDLDGDGEPEIVVVANAGTVFAYETDGTVLAGWPRQTGELAMAGVPAIADLNDDGRDDVVLAATDGFLYAVSGDGTDLPGWPAVASKMVSSPVLVDLDADGNYEAVAIARDGRIWAYHHDGVAVAGWPVHLSADAGSARSPAVADLDQDGLPEIILNGKQELAILRGDGTSFPGWPREVGEGVNSPIVADLDASGDFEIVVGTADGLLTAYHVDGTIVNGWPRSFIEVPDATPFVTDVDADGDLDLVLGADDRLVRVLDLATPAVPGAAPWPGYHGGSDLRGVFTGHPYGASGSDVLPAPLPAALQLLPAAPNPFRAGTELRFSLPERAPVTLTVFDVRGRRVASPLEGTILPAGAHSLRWDGRDRNGRPVATGVYFLRLSTPTGGSRSAKVLRLR